MEEGGPRAELVAMPDGAADDTAQHVAAALVAGDDAVAHEEGAGADVVGNDLERRRVQIGGGGLARGGGDQALEQVDLVVAVDALQHRGDALQSHAGVDAGPRQRVQHARLVAVVLHEHVVPDLDEAVAVLVGAAGRPAGDVRAVVVEDFGTRPAGAGVAHHPEVVGGVARALVVADADDAVGGYTHHILPDAVGLVVLGVDGDQQALRR